MLEELGPWAYHSAESPASALAQMLASSGRTESAVQLYRTLCEQMPDDAGLVVHFARFMVEIGRELEAQELFDRATALQTRSSNPLTRASYRLVLGELEQRGVPLVAVQYPGRPIAGLKALFEPDDHVIFVDTERVFREAIEQRGFGVLFEDACYGDFGHGSPEGNRLLAETVARAMDDAGLFAMNGGPIP